MSGKALANMGSGQVCDMFQIYSSAISGEQSIPMQLQNFAAEKGSDAAPQRTVKSDTFFRVAPARVRRIPQLQPAKESAFPKPNFPS